MHLLTPRTYRLFTDQDDWLQRRANEQGHKNKSITLRMLITKEMKAEQKRKGAA